MQSRNSTSRSTRQKALLEHENSPERIQNRSRVTKEDNQPLSQLSMEQVAENENCEERSRLISKEN